MSSYTIIKKTDMLIFTDHHEFGQQVWSAGRLTYKHDKDACAVCAMPIGNYGFRPVTNKANRMKRICMRHTRD